MFGSLCGHFHLVSSDVSRRHRGIQVSETIWRCRPSSLSVKQSNSVGIQKFRHFVLSLAPAFDDLISSFWRTKIPHDRRESLPYSLYTLVQFERRVLQSATPVVQVVVVVGAFLENVICRMSSRLDIVWFLESWFIFMDTTIPWNVGQFAGQRKFRFHRLFDSQFQARRNHPYSSTRYDICRRFGISKVFYENLPWKSQSNHPSVNPSTVIHCMD